MKKAKISIAIMAFLFATGAAFASNVKSQNGVPACDKNPNTNHICDPSQVSCCTFQGVTYQGDYLD